MNAVRNIGRDLVDKRLWPLAVVLAVALVAVPVLLAKSSDPAPPPAPAADTAAGPGPASGQAVALTAGGGGPLQAGGLKDPFRQQNLPKPPPDITSVVVDDTSVTETSGGSGGNTPQSTDQTGGGKDTGSEPEDTTVRALVRFGTAGAQLPTRKVEAGSPLPSTGEPLVIYLGLLRDGKTAQFLVSSEANAQGDGVCVPSANVCATVKMKPGQTEFLDVASGPASRQYQLDYLGPKVG